MKSVIRTNAVKRNEGFWIEVTTCSGYRRPICQALAGLPANGVSLVKA